jgi:acyl-coenzyme A thioesterase PaaI-like protein
MASNQMSRMVGKLSALPAGMQQWAQTFLLGKVVPFLGTAGMQFEQVTPQRVVVSVANKRKVQNHIKGIHAAAMALLAETATGFVVGMNLPDDKLPLLKSMKINYVRRSSGDMRAVAELTPQQVQSILNDEKGEVTVSVVGRHDPCVAPRAVPIAEAMVALTLIDHLLLYRLSHL